MHLIDANQYIDGVGGIVPQCFLLHVSPIKFLPSTLTFSMCTQGRLSTHPAGIAMMVVQSFWPHTRGLSIEPDRARREGGLDSLPR